jgi:hypothetical protein
MSDDISYRKPWEEEWEFRSGAYPDNVYRKGVTRVVDGVVVCEVWHDGNEIAQFVATAPELYRALAACLDRMSCLTDNDGTQARAIEALRKARGES